MKKLLSSILYVFLISLITSGIHAEESKELVVGLFVDDSDSYDGARLAIKEYNRGKSKFSVHLIRLNCDERVMKEQADSIRRAKVLVVAPTGNCSNIQGIFEAKLTTVTTQLRASFLTKDDKQLIPQDILNIVSFPVNLPLSKKTFFDKYTQEMGTKPEQKSIDIYTAVHILLKAIDMSPSLSIEKMREEVEKFKVVRVDKAPLRHEPPATTSPDFGKIGEGDVVIHKGDVVILQSETKNNYLKVEPFLQPDQEKSQEKNRWIQRYLVK